MTRFVREQFEYHGGYLNYRLKADSYSYLDTKFVAQFKYASTSSKGSWITFMIKHFTVEEYFAELATGKSPLPVMAAKGYELAHIRKWRREGKLPENYKMFG